MNVLRAKMLVRQLTAERPIASVSRRRCCSFLQAGSVMPVLPDSVASYDATDKLKVESTNTCKPRRRFFWSVVS